MIGRELAHQQPADTELPSAARTSLPAAAGRAAGPREARSTHAAPAAWPLSARNARDALSDVILWCGAPCGDGKRDPQTAMCRCRLSTGRVTLPPRCPAPADAAHGFRCSRVWQDGARRWAHRGSETAGAMQARQAREQAPDLHAAVVRNSLGQQVNKRPGGTERLLE